MRTQQHPHGRQRVTQPLRIPGAGRYRRVAEEDPLRAEPVRKQLVGGRRAEPGVEGAVADEDVELVRHGSGTVSGSNPYAIRLQRIPQPAGPVGVVQVDRGFVGPGPDRARRATVGQQHQGRFRQVTGGRPLDAVDAVRRPQPDKVGFAVRAGQHELPGRPQRGQAHAPQ
jgi:hypothetical protein